MTIHQILLIVGGVWNYGTVGYSVSSEDLSNLRDIYELPDASESNQKNQLHFSISMERLPLVCTFLCLGQLSVDSCIQL